MRSTALSSLAVSLLSLGACSASAPPQNRSDDASLADDPADASTGEDSPNTYATITQVNASGEPGGYTLSVGISSPDTGCNRYANWWEVLTDEGTLVYRRILGHSHVDEQPFVRSGGPVSVNADEDIIVRAHMNDAGYGRQVFRGSVSGGFAAATLDEGAFAQLGATPPLPDSCAF